jgi:hypothetical protein
LLFVEVNRFVTKCSPGLLYGINAPGGFARKVVFGLLLCCTEKIQETDFSCKAASGGGTASFCNDEACDALSQLRVSMIGGATLGDARSISTETNPWSHIWWKSLPIRGLFPVG